MSVRISVFLCLIAIVCGVSSADAANDPLRNEDIVKMVSSGMTSDLIQSIIGNAECAFDVQLDAVLALKQQNVPNEVIKAMVDRSSRPAEFGATVYASGNGDLGFDTPTEIGVYYQDPQNGALVFIDPEPVTAKTGGFLKRMAKGKRREENGRCHPRNVPKLGPKARSIIIRTLLRLNEEEKGRSRLPCSTLRFLRRGGAIGQRRGPSGSTIAFLEAFDLRP